MTYAIVKINGRQYKVEEGDLLKVDLAKNPEVEVLFLSTGKSLLTSKEELEGATVVLEPIKDGRDRKVRVGRFKSKSRYKKVRGHRSAYSMLKVASINHPSIEKTEKAEKPVKEVKVKKETKVTEAIKAAKAPKKTTEKKTTKVAVKKTTSKKLTGTKTEA